MECTNFFVVHPDLGIDLIVYVHFYTIRVEVMKDGKNGFRKQSIAGWSFILPG